MSWLVLCTNRIHMYTPRLLAQRETQTNTAAVEMLAAVLLLCASFLVAAGFSLLQNNDPRLFLIVLCAYI